MQRRERAVAELREEVKIGGLSSARRSVHS